MSSDDDDFPEADDEGSLLVGPWAVGQHVVLYGFSGWVDVNGVFAQLLEWIPINSRWRFQILNGLSKGDSSVRVKESNIFDPATPQHVLAAQHAAEAAAEHARRAAEQQAVAASSSSMQPSPPSVQPSSSSALPSSSTHTTTTRSRVRESASWGR